MFVCLSFCPICPIFWPIFQCPFSNLSTDYGKNKDFFFESFFKQQKMSFWTLMSLWTLVQRRLDPGKEGRKGFFQVQNHKEYQNVVIISFVHLEKINVFCFMYNVVAQKLSLPRPLENQTLNGCKLDNFKGRDFSFWI